jgi:hypothetical protein
MAQFNGEIPWYHGCSTAGVVARSVVTAGGTDAWSSAGLALHADRFRGAA